MGIAELQFDSRREEDEDLTDDEVCCSVGLGQSNII
jgi:hypothetical protein